MRGRPLDCGLWPHAIGEMRADARHEPRPTAWAGMGTGRCPLMEENWMVGCGCRIWLNEYLEFVFYDFPFFSCFFVGRVPDFVGEHCEAGDVTDYEYQLNGQGQIADCGRHGRGELECY